MKQKQKQSNYKQSSKRSRTLPRQSLFSDNRSNSLETLKLSTFQSAKDISSALGLFQNVQEQRFYNRLASFFVPLPAPKSGDWLSSKRELGQTFKEYTNNNQPIKDKSKTIYLLPLQPIISMSLIQKLEYMVHGFYYQVPVKLLGMMDISKVKEVHSRQPSDISRKQYHAGDILNYLEKMRPKDAYCLVGFLISDIYPKEEWNYVFGLADSTKRVGVFSFARYHESFYSNNIFPDEKNDDADLVSYRACKVMCHELGHLFNLRHCIYYQCLMNGSNSLEEASQKPFELCPICLRKLMYKMNTSAQKWLENFCECLCTISVLPFGRDAIKIAEQLKILK